MDNFANAPFFLGELRSYWAYNFLFVFFLFKAISLSDSLLYKVFFFANIVNLGFFQKYEQFFPQPPPPLFFSNCMSYFTLSLFISPSLIRAPSFPSSGPSFDNTFLLLYIIFLSTFPPPIIPLTTKLLDFVLLFAFGVEQLAPFSFFKANLISGDQLTLFFFFRLPCPVSYSLSFHTCPL